jgi:hypothetical protein
MIDPLRILQARAEARAMLFAASEFDLDEALAPLYSYAIESGVIEEFGMDLVTNILHDAFAERAGLEL